MTQLIAWSYSRLEGYETCPRKYYHLQVAKDVTDTKGDAAIYGDETHKAFKMYVKTGQELPLHLLQYKQYLDQFIAAPGHKIAEQQVAINADFKQVEWFDKTTYLRVINDLLVHQGSNAVIVDYKTGKPKDDFTQLELAAAVVFLLGPDINSITMAYFWLKTKTIVPKIIKRAEAPLVWAKLQPRVQAFQDAYAANAWPPKPNYLCRKYCPVASCEYHGK